MSKFYVETGNVRPSQSTAASWVRAFLNHLRNILYFRFRAPWVVRGGFVRIPWSVELWSPHKSITMGHRVQFGKGCLVHCDAVFGNSVLIARNVAFINRDDHEIGIVGKSYWDSPRGDKYKVIVEDDVWVGHGSIVLSGVTIGEGSMVAAGSVVNKDVPPYSIVGGVPAIVIKKRFEDEDTERHQRLMGEMKS